MRGAIKLWLGLFVVVALSLSVPSAHGQTCAQVPCVTSFTISGQIVGNSHVYATGTVTISQPSDGSVSVFVSGVGVAGVTSPVGANDSCCSLDGLAFGVPQGQSSVTFQIGATGEITSQQVATLSAAVEGNPNQVDPGMSATVTIIPAQYSVSMSPTTIIAGDPNSAAIITITRNVSVRSSLLFGTANTCAQPFAQLMNSTQAQLTITAQETPVTEVTSITVVQCASPTNTVVGQVTLTVIGDDRLHDHGPCDECEGAASNPVNLGTGDVWITKTDYSVPGLAGGLSLTRTWNSLWRQAYPAPVFQAGMFGMSWTSNLEERLQFQDSTHIKYWRADGNGWIFLQGTSGSFTTVSYSIQTPKNQHVTLTYDNVALLYTLSFPDGSQKVFNNNGYLQSWSDRNGNTTTISYDSSKRITQVAAPGGQSLTFTYSNSQSPNLVTSAQDSVGNVASYNYTGTLLSQVTYPDGSALQYAYDNNNNITSVSDALGKTIETHTYDNQGHALTSSEANGVNAISLQYSSNGSNTILTDSKGNSTTNYFTSAGGKNRIDFVDGSSCNSCGALPHGLYDYDQNGNRMDWFDASQNEDVSYTRDSQGNVTSLDIYVKLNGSPQDVNYTYTYNSFGEVLTVTDPLGNVTTNRYDTKGNLLTTTTPSPDGTAPGSTTTFTYDLKGELLTIQDPRGNIYTISYTPAGLVASITDPLHNVTSFQYDGRGNRTSVTDAAGQTTNYTFDSMNRLTKITYPDSSTTQLVYDARGRRASVTDGNSKTTSYAYDDADRLISVTDAAGHVTAYAYDTENNLTSITDAAGRTTSFAYDANRRVVQTTFPSSLTEKYSYDVDGNLLTKTDRKGNTINYTYDQLSRLIQKTYPDSTSVSYSYDLASQLTQVTDPTGTYQFTYDNLGRLTHTSTQYAFLTGHTLTDTYTYDAASNRASLTDPQGGLTNYIYDPLNRLTILTDFAGDAFGFTYDALSRRTGLTRPNGIKTSYSYDSLSHLLSVTHQGPLATLDGAAYAYDAAGNRISRTPLPTGIATNFGYDAIYQLLAATQGSTTKESYTYDAVGNRLTSLSGTYAVNSSNEMTSNPTGTFTYDSNGNVLTKTDSTGTTSYSWDFENRLTAVALPGSAGTVSFKYDPFGRRIYKSSSSGTSVHAYDGDNLIEETDATGTAVARYTQGPSIDEPLAMLRSSATSYYEADGLGSITSLTNSSGAIADTYTYDSFGNLTASSGSVTNAFRYTAREFDTEANLYYYRTRHYDATSGRFLSEDPARFSGAGNFYTYTGNRPLTLVDPSGELTQVAVGGMVGDNIFGHISIIIDGEVFSYGTNYTGGPPGTRDWGGNAQDFLNAQGSRRETTLLDLNITQAQENALLNFLLHNNPYSLPYSAVKHSCATVIEDALVQTGVLRDQVVVNPNGGEFSTAGSVTPAGVAGDIYLQGLVRKVSAVGQTSTGFWASLFGTLKAGFSH